MYLCILESSKNKIGMYKFKKVVAIEPVGLEPWAEERLRSMACDVTMHADIPQDADEIVRRIGGAVAVLLGYT